MGEMKKKVVLCKLEIEDWLVYDHGVSRPIAKAICRAYELRHGRDRFIYIHDRGGFDKEQIILMLVRYIEENK